MNFPRIPIPNVKPLNFDKNSLYNFDSDDVVYEFDLTNYFTDVIHQFDLIDEAILLKFLTDKGYSITHEHPEYMGYVMSKLKPKDEDNESTDL